jgi:UDP-GlcNAc3NAcA epimerase
MYDAVLMFKEKALQKSTILDRKGLKGKKYVLATVHRASNTDNADRLARIMGALDEVAQKLPVILPLHPRTRKAMEREDISANQVTLIDPVEYLDMLALESEACVIATDSGGIQKEAFFHRVPCVTMREETEWTELVEMGWNTVASPQEVALPEVVIKAMKTEGVTGSPYGNGKAAQQIARLLTLR